MDGPGPSTGVPGRQLRGVVKITTVHIPLPKTVLGFVRDWFA
jgi:hypothetical protein